MQKASAWYIATYFPYEDVEKYYIGSHGVPYLSFPWVVSDYLMEIFKITSLSQPTTTIISVETKISDTIMEFWKSNLGKLIQKYEDRLRLRL